MTGGLEGQGLTSLCSETEADSQAQTLSWQTAKRTKYMTIFMNMDKAGALRHQHNSCKNFLKHSQDCTAYNMVKKYKLNSWLLWSTHFSWILWAINLVYQFRPLTDSLPMSDSMGQVQPRCKVSHWATFPSTTCCNFTLPNIFSQTFEVFNPSLPKLLLNLYFFLPKERNEWPPSSTLYAISILIHIYLSASYFTMM